MDGYSRCSHSRVGSMLAKLRCSGYWVPQGRQAAKKVLALCSWCKRFNTRPVLLPNVASLPVPCVQFEELFYISWVISGWRKEPWKEKYTCFYLLAWATRRYTLRLYQTWVWGGGRGEDGFVQIHSKKFLYAVELSLSSNDQDKFGADLCIPPSLDTSYDSRDMKPT